MTANTDGLQDLVRAFGEALYNDPGEKPMPMATTDAVDVIRAQLTENTGTHFLDSGSAYGRHWEENQETPPWEQPEWDVGGSYVTHNVYHHMERVFGRSRSAVALEAALYAFGRSDDYKRDSWLTCMEAFAESLLNNEWRVEELSDLGLPEEFVEDVMGVQQEVRPDRSGFRSSKPEGPFTANTYNGSGCHGLSQVLQGTNVGGPYADYVFLQVHQGADVRGGYTGPRVYVANQMWVPMELSFRCSTCGWTEAESCLHHDDGTLLYQSSIDPSELEEKGWLPKGEAEEHPALDEAYDSDHIDGAVFHRCRVESGHFGHVTF